MSEQVSDNITVEPWGRTSHGEPVRRFTLKGPDRLTMRVLDFGATITELHAPDPSGQTADVVLGCDSVEPYENQAPYFGSAIGRCANRIARARFELDEVTYPLSPNDEPHSLHGGARGFDKYLWATRAYDTAEGPTIDFRRMSPDGEEGYPGNLSVRILYTLCAGPALRIQYMAVTDRPTIVNLTNHSYFNLAGHNAGDILDHEIQIHADAMTPADATLIPTGEIVPVAGTPFDFTSPRPIGRDIERAGGYDLNYVLKENADSRQVKAARVTDPKSGRRLTVTTDQPGIQLYSGNFLDGSLFGKGGAAYGKHAGFCLETQLFPDAIHHPNFPSPRLAPGQEYQHLCEYRFG